MDEAQAKTLAVELVKELNDKQPKLRRLARYYAGDHDLPVGPKKAQEKYKQLLRKSRGNLMALVANAVIEREQVLGFRYGEDEQTQKLAWRIWQASRMDAQQRVLHRRAASVREGFTIVWPRANGSLPRISVESPSQVHVRLVDGESWEREAAVKSWVMRDKRRAVTLYGPDAVFRWTTRPQRNDVTRADDLTPRPDDTGRHVLPHKMAAVPVVPYWPRLDLDGCPIAEFEDLIDDQDRLNETIFGRLIATWFASFRQKWATGLDVPNDPQTGQPVEPFDAAIDRLLWNGNPESRFGDFGATDLENYTKAEAHDIEKYIAAPSQTPPHYLLGDMVNIPEGALRIAEAGLVSKVKERLDELGEAHEETMRLSFRAMGVEAGDTADSETIWRSPEFRSESELVDALQKMSSLGVPEEALWERWGATPQQISKWKEMQTSAAARQGLGDLASLLSGKPG